MPKQYIAHLEQGDLVQDVFLLSKIELKTTKTGNFYLAITLADKTGNLPAIKWDATRQLFTSLPGDSFVRVRGTVEVYRDRPQIIVHSIDLVDEEKVDVTEFLPTTEKDMDKLWSEILKALDSITGTYLKELVNRFLEDKEFVTAFRKCPAAIGMHHAYIGGLLEHTHSVVMLAGWVTRHYTQLDRDLLVAGSFLHDIGKIKEYAYQRSIAATDRGALVGHLIIGSHMIHRKAALVPGFPEELLDILDHLVLSHHGQYEFGSPRLPMTAEAVMLHYLDNMDAKMNAFYKLVEETPDPKAAWTEWTRMFERRLYRGTFLRQTDEEKK
jgi:3'-5' exoribonuclease